MTRTITSMLSRIPPGQSGNVEIKHAECSEVQARYQTFKTGLPMKAGTFVVMIVDDEVMMSDAPNEVNTCQEVVERADGDVLIAGLGIGMILVPILAAPEVRSVTVIEANPHVVKLVLPHVRKFDGHEKLMLVQSRIEDWQPPPGRRWDTIFFDIWPTITDANLPEMERLKRRFAKRLNRVNPRAWMGCWSERLARAMRKVKAHRKKHGGCVIGNGFISCTMPEWI